MGQRCWHRKSSDIELGSHVISAGGSSIVSNVPIVICGMIAIISHKSFKRWSGLLSKIELSNVLYSGSGPEIDS